MMKTPNHPARELLRLASLTFLISLLVMSSGCETTGFGAIAERGEPRAERLAEQGNHTEAASAYIALASEATDTERDRLTLLAVEQWLDAGDVGRAKNAFASVIRPTVGDLVPLWNTNSAALSLYEGDADAALNLLEPMSREPLSTRDRLRVEALRADGWFQKQDPARAVELMVQRERLISSSRGIELNRARLWKGLLVSRPALLREAAERSFDPVVRGWLNIAALAVSTGQQGIAWSTGVARWRVANPQHPAVALLDDVPLPEQVLLSYPRQVALMLPLSGRAERAGSAVLNGFLGAYFASASGLDDRQRIRIYDVNAEGGASAAYSLAVDDGAEFVVGPLLKNNVMELANGILPTVPVLTLNYLPDDTLVPPGLFQFALAPEDEAASAAQRAAASGYSQAVALVPENDWGRRVLTSFATEFEGLGGRLLDYQSFSPDRQDFSNDIEDLMALSGSVQRYQRLRANIGKPLQFDPRRRQDADFIFMASDAATGRLLKSQLKFHYSGDIPVFSTSSVNSMDGRSNIDLNGVMFTDTPWLIAPQPGIEQLPPMYAEYWPDERRLGRLHAMGYDAYNLIAALFAVNGDDMLELDGATGTLFLDTAGRVHRRLSWAQFRGGKVVRLPDLDGTGNPVLEQPAEDDTVSPDTDDGTSWDGTLLEL
jgi:outer membrane PBP1 activator LpoA protein